jgi:hypothetical protein
MSASFSLTVMLDAHAIVSITSNFRSLSLPFDEEHEYAYTRVGGAGGGG